MAFNDNPAHVAALNQLISELEADGVKIVDKRGWFWKALHYIVLVVTFGGQRDFLKGYYTTIAHWIGVPEGWDERSAASRFAVLKHEYIHICQARKLGFGNAVVGLPLYGLLYLLVPLPLGLAYFRWRYEREAYVIGIRARLELQPHLRMRLIDSAIKQLTTGRYGWTWPFKRTVRRYFETHVPEATPVTEGDLQLVP